MDRRVIAPFVECFSDDEHRSGAKFNTEATSLASVGKDMNLSMRYHIVFCIDGGSPVLHRLSPFREQKKHIRTIMGLSAQVGKYLLLHSCGRENMKRKNVVETE